MIFLFFQGSGRLWNEYQEQKNDLDQLLAKAEAELLQAFCVVEPNQIADELRARHQANVELRQATESILRQMKTTLEELSSWISVEQRKLLDKELLAIEKRMKDIQASNVGKIALLDEFCSRMKALLVQVGILSSFHSSRITIEDLSTKSNHQFRIHRLISCVATTSIH